MRYLAMRKNSQLKAFINKYARKRQKLLDYYKRHESKLDNFVLMWGFVGNLTLAKSKFLVANGFVYVNFLKKLHADYMIKDRDCVTVSYFGRRMHKEYFH